MTSPAGSLLTANEVQQLDFSKNAGLIPAIVQHADNGAVLMLGYMNREALMETLTRKRVVFYSRSKQRLWEKGETSGNTLDLVGARADCDQDTLLVAARPRGPSCHLGLATCFGDEPLVPSEQIAFLNELETIIAQRLAGRPEGSYTARLYSQGIKRIAQKVGEEGLELALAAAAEEDDKVVGEAADLLFHVLILLKSRGLSLPRVVAELESRYTADRAVTS
jgi:phosphoribosyl-AMP cyclohydrolase / phosphoribosyl-ATP pyrophosphohydrolase